MQGTQSGEFISIQISRVPLELRGCDYANQNGRHERNVAKRLKVTVIVKHNHNILFGKIICSGDKLEVQRR